MSGWLAHILEQYENNRLIRPRADYTGPTHQTYVPVEKKRIIFLFESLPVSGRLNSGNMTTSY
ncbi:hypothetical protein GCM10020331_032400 [Ectobacillus funiculus]